MLHLYHSNRLENLCRALELVLDDAPADPFQREAILVQNQGMARWIAQQLADHRGIAANLDFPLPASFVWRVLRAWFPDLPEDSGFGREELLWRIMALLPGLLEDPAFSTLGSYLKSGPRDLKAYQLCRRIADVFDQYLVYRPDMLLDWEQGADDAQWQAKLWRALREGSREEHRAAVLGRFRQAMAADLPPTATLPERVSLFGLTALAPAYLEVLTALARHREVHLFLLNPCREYWADIVDERGQARRRARARRDGDRDTTTLLDVGNPLLASMWHGGRDFLDQLIELEADEHELFEAPPPDSLLHRLQGDLLELKDARLDVEDDPDPVDPQDRSLQVHVCHSPLREVQVLHDQLLRLFDTLPGLEPREVVVMAPDIDTYAPYVEAVFGTAGARREIPWSIADRRTRAERPVLEALVELLGLPGSRLEASQVLSLLEVPALRRRFGIDSAGLERVRTWVGESAIRWGSDGAMRQELDLPPEDANTWSFGLARLFLGYALPADSDLYEGVAPYPDVEGGEAEDLGALQAFVDRLEVWRGRLAGSNGAGRWRELIDALLGDFFLPDLDDEEPLQAVREALEALQQQAEAAGFTGRLPLELVRAHLMAALEAPAGARRFLTGGVTFCNMVPMRSIPFRVVCLLGMNGDDFPRSQRPPTFDLIAKAPRRGDRSRRLDDRYLFLEALLCARELLYLSYVGRDVRDNSRKVPSVLVSELLDYLGRGYRLAADEALPDSLVTEHPLQPFSARYFDGSEPRLFSYAQDWLGAAQAQRGADAVSFADARLSEADDEERTLDLRDLIRFLENPSREFIKRRLGLRLAEGTDLPEDEEPFAIQGLDKYQVRQVLTAGLEEGDDGDLALAQARATGLAPHGVLGDLALRGQLETAEVFMDRLAELAGSPQEPLEVDLSIAGFRLQGGLSGLSDRGLLLHHLGRLRARDCLRLWLRHLVLCLMQPAGVAPRSTHLGETQQLELAPVADAASLLADLLRLRWEGLRRPLPFFPETSLDWARRGTDDGKLRAIWDGGYHGFAEGADPAFALAFRDSDPFGGEFMTLADRVYGPLLEAADVTDWQGDGR